MSALTLNTLQWSSGLSLICFVVLWIVASSIRKVHIIDVFWGLSFQIHLGCALYFAVEITAETATLSLLIFLWGLRLAVHLAPRIRHEEDRRYKEMRTDKTTRYFVIWSLFAIFGLQWLLSSGLSLPFVTALMDPQTESMLPMFGLGVTAVGLVYEAVADEQLKRFLKRRSDAGEVCNHGLWRLSRHPNYFGELVFWWGMWLTVIGLGAGLVTIYAPLTMTFLLLKVSGVERMELGHWENRPKFQDYRQTTNAIVPSLAKFFES